MKRALRTPCVWQKDSEVRSCVSFQVERHRIMTSPPSDPIELWGKRIGRGIALLAAPFVLYALGRDLGWW
jgi:hypothetical protein